MSFKKTCFDAVTLVAIVCMIGAFVWAALAIQKRSQAVEGPVSPIASTDDIPTVSWVMLEPREVKSRLQRRSVVAPAARVEVVSENTARIVARNVQVGVYVEKGEILLELDGTIAMIQLDAAQAELASAEALLVEAEAELTAARELEDEELEDQTAARRDAVEASVRLAETSLAKAEITYERRIIEAPISGIISQCFLDEGEFAAAGRPVAEIVLTDPVRVIVTLTSQELDELSRATATWRVAGHKLNGESCEARLLFKSPVADPLTKRFELVLEVDNQDGTFMIGSKVDAICDWAATQPALTIPRKALVLRDSSMICFRIQQAGQTDVCRETSVRIASVPGLPNVVRVLDGLAKDDRVAVGRLLNLRDGLQVRLQE